ncbi:uncharacterized protein LOC129219863 [Uloborus diversus]|uniref:uncharacterized protein LOC129219863 n=1 Tax=Uloborus diversus TaxID=327109 RepID=UPI00240A48C2|nr:uncharacterized protein LOC129219863 [Uloborus diversus]
MALLYRFSRLNDRSNTGVFTFIVTRSVTRDIHRDATTKDFSFGYHRWAVSFTRTDKVLGVFLILRNPSEGTRCYIDYAFTILNREHFSKNETYAEKQCRFGVDRPAHGTNKWMPMGELKSRRFTDENWEFLMELSVSNAMTVFEGDVKIHHVPHSSSGQKAPLKLETSYFTFGNFEWNVSILPHGDETDTNNRPRVLLNRLTGFDHQCRVMYRVVLGEGERKIDSGILDQISDMSGRIRGFSLRCQVTDLVRRAVLRVYTEMICANTISEAKVPTTRDPNSTSNCYDRDKQGWCVEADLEGEQLRLKLFYSDLHNVPRNHLRSVSWNAYVVRDHPSTGTKESVIVLNAPHNNYYVQDGVDTGVIMETNIPVRQVREMNSAYLENNTHLTVHIEWLESMLLFSALYHKYDDVCRIHGHQMKREITALQVENYSLERQLFSYQKSLAISHTRAQHSEDLEDEYYNDHYYDRSLSEAQSFSESEYA